MSSAKYVQEAVRNIEDYIEKNLRGRKLKKNPTYSWPSNYTTEDDDSPELPPNAGILLPTSHRGATLDRGAREGGPGDQGIPTGIADGDAKTWAPRCSIACHRAP